MTMTHRRQQEDQALATAGQVHHELRKARGLLAQVYPLLTRVGDLSVMDVAQAEWLAVDIRKFLDDPENLAEFVAIVGGVK